MAQNYGYVRVSTKEQCEDRQLVAMRDFGVSEKDIFLDKVSGKDFQRPAYRRLLQKIETRVEDDEAADIFDSDETPVFDENDYEA